MGLPLQCDCQTLRGATLEMRITLGILAVHEQSLVKCYIIHMAISV